MSFFDNFFSVLAGTNRQHYASLLVLYYRLFQESTHSLERELVVREFMKTLVDIIKAYIEPDSKVAEKIGLILKQNQIIQSLKINREKHRLR